MDELKNVQLWLQGENPPAEIIDGEDNIASHFRHLICERDEHLEELNVLIHEVDEAIKTLELKLQARNNRRKNDTGEGERLMGPQRERKMNCAEVEAPALEKNQRKRKGEPPTEETKKMNLAEVAVLALEKNQRKRKGEPPTEETKKMNYAEVAVLALEKNQRKRKGEPPTDGPPAKRRRV
jgi:hypothetical protein